MNMKDLEKEFSDWQCVTSNCWFCSGLLQLIMYTAKFLFHQPPTRHSDYTGTVTVVNLRQHGDYKVDQLT